MKVIFLDIDGVLNNLASLAEGVHMVPEKAILLRRLIEATGAKVVISSTWRMLYDLRELGEILRLAGCWNGAPIDRTPELRGSRGTEIQAWLDSGVTNVESYLILDDDSDMLESQMDSFIKTDMRTGLLSRELDRAIEILNG